MKHCITIVIALFILLLGARPAAAQPFQETPPEQRFIGGLVGGINLSQVDGDKLAGFNKIGFNAGGRVAAVLAPRWQLSMELLFTQLGSSRNNNDDPSASIDKIRLNAVEVPVMINFLEWKLHVSAGVSYLRLINYYVEDVFGEDITDLTNYNEDLFQVIIGATFFFNQRTGLNVNWSKSLNNLQGEPGAGTLLTRNVQVRGVYLF